MIVIRGRVSKKICLPYTSWYIASRRNINLVSPRRCVDEEVTNSCVTENNFLSTFFLELLTIATRLIDLLSRIRQLAERDWNTVGRFLLRKHEQWAVVDRAVAINFLSSCMLRQGKLCECREADMALVFYERRNGFELGNDSDNNAFKSSACTAGYRLYDLHRCYNLQRRSVVQRRAPRHLLEAWYFWLGIALLVVSAIFSVSILVKKCSRVCKVLGISFQIFV